LGERVARGAEEAREVFHRVNLVLETEAAEDAAARDEFEGRFYSRPSAELTVVWPSIL
jgi:hypothetical protein